VLAAAHQLKAHGGQVSDLDQRLLGVDLHAWSLAAATEVLEAEGLDAHLLAEDFFAVATPDQLGAPLPFVDAVVGNPALRAVPVAHWRDASSVIVSRPAAECPTERPGAVGSVARAHARPGRHLMHRCAHFMANRRTG
jgi:hypothetical protein